MAKFIIKQNKDECIGCGTCVSVCPGNWKMGKDGKAAPKKKEVTQLGCNQEAIDSCPVQCISAKEK